MARLSTASALLAAIATAFGCAHARPDPPAASFEPVVISVLVRSVADAGYVLHELAEADSEGVRPYHADRCSERTRAFVPIVDGRAATVSVEARELEGRCTVELPTEIPTGRDLVALSGGATGPLEPIDPGLVEGGFGELAAVDDVRTATAGAFNDQDFVIDSHVRAYEFYATRWLVISLHYRPRETCKLPVCAFENRCASASQSAVVVYSWNKFARFRGRQSLRQRWIHIERAEEQAEFGGLIEHVGMVAVDGADTPWLVTSKRRCTTKDFQLVGPGGSGWTILAGPKP